MSRYLVYIFVFLCIPSLQAADFVERGRVYAQKPFPIVVDFNGIVTYFCKSGTLVKKGDLLMETSTDTFVTWLEETTLSLQNKEVELKLNESILQTIEKVEDSKRAMYAAELAHAQLVLSHMKKGLTTSQRRALSIEIELLELELDEYKQKEVRQQRLITKGFAIESSINSIKRQLAAKEVALQTAQTNRIQQLKGAQPEDLIEQEAEVERLFLKTQRHSKRMLILLRERELTIEKRQAEIDKFKHLIKKRSREAVLARSLAPQEGIFFLRQHRDWASPTGWSEHQAGSKKWSGDIIGDLINPQELQIEVLVHEADISQLYQGMEVGIALPALGAIQLTGKLKELSQLGKDLKDLSPLGTSSGLSQQAYFSVVIEVTPSKEKLVIGMSAICTFKKVKVPHVN